MVKNWKTWVACLNHEFVEIRMGRKKILEDDSMQKWKRLFKDGTKPFHICFVGEEAVGHGGPFKEHFISYMMQLNTAFIYRW